jgi:hypothetical protein
MVLDLFITEYHVESQCKFTDEFGGIDIHEIVQDHITASNKARLSPTLMRLYGSQAVQGVA